MNSGRDGILSAPIFIGPEGEGIDLLRDLIGRVLEDHRRYRLARGPGPAAAGPREAPSAGDLVGGLDRLLGRLHATYPYFHPRYAAQMIKDPAVPAVLGYLAAMLMNPNNHAYEGGPATTEMELEVVESLLRLVGFDGGWGHLCSGGTLANLEAMWAVRDTRREGAVLFSRASHYSLRRNAAILRMPGVIEIETDGRFRLDANHLETVLRKERTMLVIANLGTTGTGSVDPIADLLPLRDRYGFHLHVDAAYGGYARSCILDPDGALRPHPDVASDCGMSAEVYRHMAALGGADSVTVDPHKHGLSPYGAGSVLYRDTGLKGPLLNTAPYTYHLADRPNLGMITLEGSRPGAAAAACWLTQRVVPLDATGYGAIIGAGMRVARTIHSSAAGSPRLRALHAPDLDILCLVRWPTGGSPRSEPSLGRINAETDALYRRLSVTAEGRPPLLVSRLNLPADLARRALGVEAPGPEDLGALRLVLMKHWLALPRHRADLEEAMAALLADPGQDVGF